MKKNFLIVLMVASFFLAACSEQELEILNEETLSFENIEFKKADIFVDRQVVVDTNLESLVMDLDDSQFIKTDDPDTTIHAKWIYDPSEDDEYITSTIYVSKSDIKKISRAYTKEYGATMPFDYEKE